VSNDPMTLETNDPKEALRQIASYLRCVKMTGSRAVKEPYSSDHIELLGYWQTEAYLNGLLELADECDRIINHKG
jgi:hypothetical protein